MHIKNLAATALALCLGFGSAFAAEPQVERQAGMKAIGASMGALAAIAKEQKPFDAEAVKTALTTISTSAKAFPDQFPVGSETGHDTEASPKIWENPSDFRAKSLKLAADADAVLAAAPTDVAGVMNAMQTLGAECGQCHQTYRLKR
ncbi:cytochrome c556 [Neorhizobium huautlense]|uniref:Cytochrome c556 n=1 Tax=Neorhizobium huautlense TaxID=67774 RepID=A0ABT9PMT8_9HYPH|nr:cytochrome c [Neorhizobium huautlense]MDP9835778.1 cytochrome c556 [Neorhizobium huautlense]